MKAEGVEQYKYTYVHVLTWKRFSLDGWILDLAGSRIRMWAPRVMVYCIVRQELEIRNIIVYREI